MNARIGTAFCNSHALRTDGGISQLICQLGVGETWSPDECPPTNVGPPDEWSPDEMCGFARK